MKITTLLTLLLMVMCTMTHGNEKSVSRPAVVLVAFGTSVPEARKVFDHIDRQARKRFPEHDVRWAFTSQFILRKLRRQGVDVKGLPEVIAELRQEGQTAAVFQSLHIAPGQEYHEISRVDTAGMKIAVGDALLADDQDIQQVIDAVGDDLDPATPNVVVCHGNKRHPELNRQLIAFAEKIEAKYDNVVVCSVEGQPGAGKLSEAKKQAATTGRVNFIPLMVVAGTHVMEDVMGEQEGSFKSIIGAPRSQCTKPLGYNDKVLEVFFQHLDEALARLDRDSQQASNR